MSDGRPPGDGPERYAADRARPVADSYRSSGRTRAPLAHDVSALSPTRNGSVLPWVTNNVDRHDRPRVGRPAVRSARERPENRTTILSPLDTRMSTLLEVGRPMSISAGPGICGCNPIEANTYQAQVAPPSLLHNSPLSPV